MRRSVCYVEPFSVRAGQISTWRFFYTTSVPLPKGTKLIFDLCTNGKVIDWEMPNCDLTAEKNVIYLETTQGKIIKAKAIKTANPLVFNFEFILNTPIEARETLTIIMGAPPGSSREDELGNGAQLFTQRRKPFYLYVDVKGKTGNTEDPEVFLLDIRGNILKSIKVLTPSFVSKNKRFDITVRFEDEFDNLTSFAPEETLIELYYEHLRENLSWRLFVPETGFVILPNLYFNEIGIFKIRLKNLATKEEFVSSPIKCFPETSLNLFWGLLHGESERIDALENIEACLRNFRDEKALNFFATSPFENEDSLTPDLWKLISQNVIDFNEEDRFITMLGFQYVGTSNSEGTRTIIYSKDHKYLLKHKDSKNSSLSKIYKNFSPKEIISIPCFTASSDCGFDFEKFHPDFERIVEIYNSWGSSEILESEGNPFPIKGPVSMRKQGTLLNALKNNCRFGFVAGGLDDRGIYSRFYDTSQVQYRPGLTAILCSKYNRESVIDALYHRKCYATTGERIIVEFYISGFSMGSEISIAQKPGLKINRHISGCIAGTNTIKKIELIRNGDILYTMYPEKDHVDYEYDDMVNLEDVALTVDGHSFAFYYLKVYQIDALAWASPIWIDLKNTSEIAK